MCKNKDFSHEKILYGCFLPHPKFERLNNKTMSMELQEDRRNLNHLSLWFSFIEYLELLALVLSSLSFHKIAVDANNDNH